jgi:RNA polymerase sigma-70 factor (ECF subfamily)
MTTTYQTTPQQRELAQLVRAAQSGSRTAFGTLVEQYQGLVMSIALRRLGNYAEAQELSQDVFVKAMEKLDQLREPACFGAWLRSIINRMAINRAVRRTPVITAENEVMEGRCAEEQTPLSIVLERERSSQVRAGLRRLRDMDRETLEAFYVEGQSLREMSERFEAPLGTIKRRLHVARKRLSREVEEIVAV